MVSSLDLIFNFMFPLNIKYNEMFLSSIKLNETWTFSVHFSVTVDIKVVGLGLLKLSEL